MLALWPDRSSAYTAQEGDRSNQLSPTWGLAASQHEGNGNHSSVGSLHITSNVSTPDVGANAARQSPGTSSKWIWSFAGGGLISVTTQHAIMYALLTQNPNLSTKLGIAAGVSGGGWALEYFRRSGHFLSEEECFQSDNLGTGAFITNLFHHKRSVPMASSRGVLTHLTSDINAAWLIYFNMNWVELINQALKCKESSQSTQPLSFDSTFLLATIPYILKGIPARKVKELDFKAPLTQAQVQGNGRRGFFGMPDSKNSPLEMEYSGTKGACDANSYLQVVSPSPNKIEYNNWLQFQRSITVDMIGTRVTPLDALAMTSAGGAEKAIQYPGQELSLIDKGIMFVAASFNLAPIVKEKGNVKVPTLDGGFADITGIRPSLLTDAGRALIQSLPTDTPLTLTLMAAVGYPADEPETSPATVLNQKLIRFFDDSSSTECDRACYFANVASAGFAKPNTVTLVVLHEPQVAQTAFVGVYKVVGTLSETLGLGAKKFEMLLFVTFWNTQRFGYMPDPSNTVKQEIEKYQELYQVVASTLQPLVVEKILLEFGVGSS